METHDATPGDAKDAPPPRPMESLCRAVRHLVALRERQAPLEERIGATQAVTDALETVTDVLEAWAMRHG